MQRNFCRQIQNEPQFGILIVRQLAATLKRVLAVGVA